MATQMTDTDILKDKRILFVEDRPETLKFFLSVLRGVAGTRIDIKQVPTLRDAVSNLTGPENRFDMVVIDLHMPGEFPDVLKPFADRIAPDLNEGQALGLWLHETHKSIPYIYLSSVPDAYFPNADDQPAQAPINKFDESPFAFPGHLAAALRAAPENRSAVAC